MSALPDSTKFPAFMEMVYPLAPMHHYFFEQWEKARRGPQFVTDLTGRRRYFGVALSKLSH